jgi:hypothetical protein
VRGLLERRREMITWYTAVLVNTTLSYQAFLDRYPNSDLAPTARKLRDRQQLRAQSAMARAIPGAGGPQNQTPQATPASLPATCSCPAPSRGKEKPRKPTREASAPRPQPAPVSEAPPISIGIGIGGGLGGIRRGGSRPPSHSPSYGKKYH